MHADPPFNSRLYPPFRFGESSEFLQHITTMLARGYSFEITPDEAEGKSVFLVSMKDVRVPYELVFQYARIGEPTFGTYMHAHQNILALGVNSLASETLNDTLDAGFPVFLIPEISANGVSRGLFTLLGHVSDNS